MIRLRDLITTMGDRFTEQEVSEHTQCRVSG